MIVIRINQLAEQLGVHRNTVRNWIKSGKLPARSVSGKRYLVSEGDFGKLCQEFNLDHPDYAAAVKTYDQILSLYQAEVVRRDVRADSNDARVADLPMLLAVERALYNKALLLENHLAVEAGADEARRRECYEQAVACYRELLHERYFGQTRFKQTQFVMFRLGVVLAENLGRVDEGVAVLKDMEKRWPESPWYGRVLWKRQQIEKAAAKR